METVVLQVDAESPDMELIEEAGAAIRAGKLVAFPTETVYGLAADAFNLAAVERVYEVKGRPAGKPLPVQVATVDGVYRLAIEVSDVARMLIDAFFPGPLTIILRASPAVPERITAGTGKIGIRMPDHQVALALIRAAGTPIVATSANSSGNPSPNSAEEVLADLDDKIDLVLDAGVSRLKTASTVVDATGTPIKILRMGGVTREMLDECISQV
jgi:L-threonylcarbamoyladenylate synthase